uniref:Uncharacterized protein n=1 Tax=viral metagenome TaxID=1070528 RepID=A0A6M3XT10_9ZZZZ
MLNYFEALEIVEDFMIKSGIRDFCSSICKGHCCFITMPTDRNIPCRDTIRPIACSMYICYDLQDCLLTKKEKHKLNSLRLVINKGWHKQTIKNVFCTDPNSIDSLNKMRFSLSLKKIISSFNISKMNRIMRDLKFDQVFSLPRTNR